ncbi:hypothetical protein BHM03_00035326 [Ensete ventricosum]|nr:hypothetical protein BHM03_00035326 [Ensete ventricosum]
MGSCTSIASQKNTAVIYYARNRTQSHVLISFSCTFSKIQSSSHSRRISPWKVVRARFREKTRRS